MNSPNIYVLVRNTYYLSDGLHSSYGIAIIDQSDSAIEVIKTISNISYDSSTVEELIRICRSMKTTVGDIDDLVEDFLS